MQRAAVAWVLTAMVGALSCEARPRYSQPPDGSYVAGIYQVKIGDDVTPVQGAAVTLEFFRGANVLPLLGRLFVDPDLAPAAAQVVVLSHDFWVERFRSDPGTIGRILEIDGRNVTVVGVGPPGFSFPESTKLWTPQANAAR